MADEVDIVVDLEGKGDLSKELERAALAAKHLNEELAKTKGMQPGAAAGPAGGPGTAAAGMAARSPGTANAAPIAAGAGWPAGATPFAGAAPPFAGAASMAMDLLLASAAA